MSVELVRAPLAPNQQVDLSFDEPLHGPAFTMDTFGGLRGEVLGEIEVGNQDLNPKLSIIHAPNETRLPSGLIVAQPGYKLGDRKGFRPVGPSVTAPFGRANTLDGLSYTPGYSARHFTITYQKDQQQARVTNLTPTNQTYLRHMQEKAADQQASGKAQRDNSKDVFDGYTERAERWAGQQARYTGPDANSKYGYYNGHHIIGRDSRRLSDGVHITLDGYELLHLKRDEAFNYAYGGLRDVLRATGPVSARNMALFATKHTESLMTYDRDRADIVTDAYTGRLLPIGEMLARKYGICRHMGAVAAMFAEKAQEDGFAAEPFRAFVERNQDNTRRGAHAWGGLEPIRGRQGPADDFIMDPAQDFYRTRREAPQDIKLRWRY